MIIQRKRIRNVVRYLPTLEHGRPIIAGFPLAAVGAEKRRQIGFPQNPEVNSAVLPAPVFGPISSFNANGKYIVHHDRPMETVTRSVFTTWEDWHGTPHSGYVNRDYRRYPRTLVPPPAVELRVSATTQDEILVTTEQSIFEPANFPAITHKINLILEIFGECHIFTENLERIIQAQLRRLNWRLLPPGARPFEQLRDEVREIVQQQPEDHQPTIMRRLETLNSHRPDFVAIGEAGFNGYVVFGFTARHIYLFESVFIDNATYVFGDNWQALSQLSKAEIITGNLAQDRIFHTNGWHQRIDQALR